MRSAIALGAAGTGSANSSPWPETRPAKPTDGTNFPDYLVTSGTLIPRVAALYAIACRGKFGNLMRFESSPARGPVGLGAVLAEVRRGLSGKSAGMVLVAESAGLLGASLKAPPVGTEPAGAANAARLFRHPEIRKWLSYSPERAFPRSVAVVAGIVTGSPPPEVAPLLRPVTPDGTLAGHFHAAAFGYHPLAKGRIELQGAVSKLFDTAGLQGVLHLLADPRPAAAAAESEFLRGACWYGPIDRFLCGGDNQ